MEKIITRTARPLPTLKNRAQFLALRSAPRYSCEDFILQGKIQQTKAGKVGQDQKPSVGYTVTKKIGNSVERNRIRRRLRQAIAEAMYRFALNSDGSQFRDVFVGEMVVVARHSAIDQDYGVLVSNFTKGIDRLVAKGNKAS